MTATIEEMRLLFKDNSDYLAYCRNSNKATKDMMIQELGREEHTHIGSTILVNTSGCHTMVFMVDVQRMI